MWTRRLLLVGLIAAIVACGDWYIHHEIEIRRKAKDDEKPPPDDHRPDH